MDATAYLRQSTLVLHRQTEAIAYGEQITSASLLPHEYRELLLKNEFIHRHLEAHLDQALRLPDLQAFVPFLYLRHPALLADLQALHLSPRQFVCSVPAFTSPAATLGCLYTVTGSRLGGQLIQKALARNPHFPADYPFHFYTDPPSLKATEWRQFCQLLNDFLVEPAALQAAADAAENTFRFYHCVYQQSTPAGA